MYFYTHCDDAYDITLGDNSWDNVLNLKKVSICCDDTFFMVRKFVPTLPLCTMITFLVVATVEVRKGQVLNLILE